MKIYPGAGVHFSPSRPTFRHQPLSERGRDQRRRDSAVHMNVTRAPLHTSHPAISSERPSALGAAGIRISRTPFLNVAFAWSVMVPGGSVMLR